jgi:hypothetical protein
MNGIVGTTEKVTSDITGDRSRNIPTSSLNHYATPSPYKMTILHLPQEDSGIGGLVVSMLPSGTLDRGFEPGRSRRIFRTKKSTACLPSEGK